MNVIYKFDSLPPSGSVHVGYVTRIKMLQPYWFLARVREGICIEGELLLLYVGLEVNCELGLAGETQLAVGAGVSVGLEVAGEGPLPTASVVTCGTGKLLASTAI